MKKITTVAQAGGHSVRVGSAAMGALLSEVMCEQRLHAQKLFRFAPTTSDNSLTLEKREASGVYAEHTPTRPKDEGDDLKLIFSLILTLLSKKIDERMEVKPRATHDKEWFHHIYWKKFAGACPRPWMEMTPSEKKRQTRAFIVQKFTLDPKGRCMLPPSGHKWKTRNDASWLGFWLTDAEVDQLVLEVMSAYEAH